MSMDMNKVASAHTSAAGSALPSHCLRPGCWNSGASKSATGCTLTRFWPQECRQPMRRMWSSDSSSTCSGRNFPFATECLWQCAIACTICPKRSSESAGGKHPSSATRS